MKIKRIFPIFCLVGLTPILSACNSPQITNDEQQNDEDKKIIHFVNLSDYKKNPYGDYEFDAQNLINSLSDTSWIKDRTQYKRMFSELIKNNYFYYYQTNAPSYLGWQKLYLEEVFESEYVEIDVTSKIISSLYNDIKLTFTFKISIFAKWHFDSQSWIIFNFYNYKK